MTWRMAYPFLNDFPVITREDIAAFETRNSLKLPEQYAAFCTKSSSFWFVCAFPSSDRRTKWSSAAIAL